MLASSFFPTWTELAVRIGLFVVAVLVIAISQKVSRNKFIKGLIVVAGLTFFAVFVVLWLNWFPSD